MGGPGSPAKRLRIGRKVADLGPGAARRGCKAGAKSGPGGGNQATLDYKSRASGQHLWTPRETAENRTGGPLKRPWEPAGDRGQGRANSEMCSEFRNGCRGRGKMAEIREVEGGGAANGRRPELRIAKTSENAPDAAHSWIF